MFEESFEDVSQKVFLRCYREAQRLFLDCIKKVSKLFPECFKEVVFSYFVAEWQPSQLAKL